MHTLRAGTPEQAGFDPSRINLIRQRAAEWTIGERNPSSVVLAARRGIVALHQADGVAKFGSDAPISEDAIFPCASLAKPVTATAIMILVEEGLMSLNRPLIEYMPEFHGEHADRIQVHHLLTHTSGFIDEMNDGVPTFVNPPAPATPPAAGQNPHTHAVVSFHAQQNCFKKPGAQNAYCTGNFTILGDLVRRVSGINLGEFARQKIFEPLGMTSTSVGWEDRWEERFVTRRRLPHMKVDLRSVMGDNGGSALYSTAHDLAVFCQMFLNGGVYGGVRILSHWTTQEMTRDQIPGIGCVNFYGRWVAEANWGLGWMIRGDARWPYSQGFLPPRGSYFHQGGSGTGLWVDPLHEVVGVYLTVAFMDPVTHEPNFEFDKYQNMVTAAVAE